MNTKTLRTNPRFVLAAVAAVCFAGYAVGAHADEAIDGVQARTVHYADLNLKTAQGAEILYKRIRTAAGRVCGEGDAKELARIAKDQEHDRMRPVLEGRILPGVAALQDKG